MTELEYEVLRSHRNELAEALMTFAKQAEILARPAFRPEAMAAQLEARRSLEKLWAGAYALIQRVTPEIYERYHNLGARLPK